MQGADTSIGGYLSSLQASSTQRCVASLHRALAGSASDSRTHEFAQRLLAQLERPPVATDPSRPATEFSSNGDGPDSVDALWERAHAMSLANGAGQGDELMKALRASDEKDAERRHRKAYDVGGGHGYATSLFDMFDA